MGVGRRAESYGVEEAGRITSVAPSTIRYWAGSVARLITAEIADSRRQGSRKLFSLRNLVQIRVAALLSEAGWPQPLVFAELPRMFRPRMDWFNPEAVVWGSVDWILFGDRKAWGGRPWSIMGVGAPGNPEQEPTWFVSGVSAHLGDFELVTMTWPDGWQPRSDLDRHQLPELVGIRRLTIVNLSLVKQRILTKSRLMAGRVTTMPPKST